MPFLATYHCAPFSVHTCGATQTESTRWPNRGWVALRLCGHAHAIYGTCCICGHGHPFTVTAPYTPPNQVACRWQLSWYRPDAAYTGRCAPHRCPNPDASGRFHPESTRILAERRARGGDLRRPFPVRPPPRPSHRQPPAPPHLNFFSPPLSLFSCSFPFLRP